MNFNDNDLDDFLEKIYKNDYSNNNGGMASPDMFSLYFALKTTMPKVVIESGVWNGLSTKLIRSTLGPDTIIICLDPRPIPSNGFTDTNPNTIYYINANFKDFKDLDLTQYNIDDIFVFFDCHINAPQRLIQATNKGIKNLFFNDNYPVNCGSHYTLEHLKNDDQRLGHYNKDQIFDLIDIYHVFPNIFPEQIKTGEGLFDCESYFSEYNPKYQVFFNDKIKYRWNTFVKLK